MIPNHIGIIVDGNGRWAKQRGLSRSLGHKAGAENLDRIVKYAHKLGVKVISLYIFSTENFKRDVKEVNYLMDLFIKKFINEFEEYNKLNIKVVFSGRREPLSEEVLNAMDTITERTKNNTNGIANFCLNYGGQAEIVDACKKVHEDLINKKITLDELNEESFYKYLYNDLPPIDFMIRTSGELRLSNFLLYQNAYAEFYFPKTYFPDFNEEEFDKALLEYNSRDRRFGGVKNEEKSNSSDSSSDN